MAVMESLRTDLGTVGLGFVTGTQAEGVWSVEPSSDMASVDPGDTLE
jgi:hypothetical protein